MTWMIFAIALNWPYTRDGGPWTKSAQAGLDYVIHQLQVGPPSYKGPIHAIAVHKEDWDSGKCVWNYIDNKIDGCVCEYLAVNYPEMSGMHMYMNLKEDQ